MNKKLIAAAMIIVLAASVGVYYLINDKKSNVSTGSTTNSQVDSSSRQTEGNALVQKVLDKVKAQTPTVKSAYVVTESTDGNNLLGKKGEYQYAGSFYDTRTGYKAYDDNGNEIDVSKDNYGADAGGTVEVFASEADATKRGAYLEQFQSGALSAGAYKVVGKVVLRASSSYTASQQQEILKLMESAL